MRASENIHLELNPTEVGVSNREDNSRCCVTTEDGYNDWFHVVTGVSHGCLLSPILSAVAIRGSQCTVLAADVRLSDL